MITPEPPENEAERLSHLRSYELLDTARETAYDNLTRLAATVCGVEMSAISFIDEKRQWVKSCFGAEIHELPRSLSLCGHTINLPRGEFLEVHDISRDERFIDNPVLKKYPVFSFYAGVPIYDKAGFALGTLCVVDSSPGNLAEQQRASLQIIAQQVSDQLELHRSKIEALQKEEQHVELLNKVDDAIYELDSQGNYLFVNTKTCELLGYSAKELKSKGAFEFVHTDDLPAVERYHRELVESQGQSGYYEMRILPKDKEPIRIAQKVSLDYKNGKLLKIRAIAREFSDVKKLRRALQDREDQYKILSENSRDVIGVHAIDGTYKYISQAAEVEMGYAPESVLGKAPKDFMHPDDWSVMKIRLKSMVDGASKSTNIECRIKKSDGEYIWMEIYTRVIHDENGLFDGFHSSARDISERKRTENKISMLIENTTDAVWAVDTDLKFIYFNTVFQTLHVRRMGREVRIGAKIQPERVDASFEEEFSFILKALEGTKCSREITFDIDDQLFVMDNSATPIRNEAGEVTGVSVFSRNITEQHKERERIYNYQIGLRLLNDLAVKSLPTAELLEHALQAICDYLDMPVGIISSIKDDAYEIKYLTDQDGILQLAKVKKQLTNTYSHLAFQNRSVVLFHHASESAYAGHPCCDKTEEVQSYLGAPIKVDDEYYGMVEFLSPIRRKDMFGDHEGEFMKLFANWLGSVMTKESAYRSLERAKESAEEASLAKADFLSMMSHEVRTPLNGIIGTTHLLLKKNPPPEQLQKLHILKKSSDHLLAIVTDILDFAKIEEGKILLENAEFNLRELLDAIRVNYETLTEEKGIQLKLNCDDKLNANYWGDQVRLNQIFHNLVNNAIKFTEKGEVTIKCLRLDKVNNFDHILFEISDTGIGIPKENLEAIFGVFSQADKSITRRFGGSGLGLSITRRLLEIMDSKIEVESERGAGTTFRFKLVLRRGSSLELQQSVSKEEKKESLKGDVLIVEDNIFNRVIAKDFCESWGLNVLEAENGKEAIALLEKRQVDIVLLDIQMPIMNGYETISWIREQEEPYFQDLPVIALTASAMIEVQNKVYKCGMNDFLTKPFVPEDFYKKMDLRLSMREKVYDEISLSYLRNILQDDKDKMRRFFDLFIESVTHDYRTYERALEGGEVIDIYQLIRKNRPTLKSLGLTILAKQAQIIEHMIENDNPKKMVIREAKQHLESLKFTVNKMKVYRESLQQTEA